MPELKRQNAFSDDQQPEPFIEVQCRTCREYEPCGEWLKVWCCCCESTGTHHYYMHKLCFQRMSWCKICQNPYRVILKRSTTSNIIAHSKIEARYSILKEIGMKHQSKIMIGIATLLSVLFLYDLCKCITLDKVGQDELQGLTDAEYLWLPVPFKVFSRQNKLFIIQNVHL